jgi:hypothetical protein
VSVVRSESRRARQKREKERKAAAAKAKERAMDTFLNPENERKKPKGK